MNIREMHYDFKQKLNKVDSQKNRDLLVPEIDIKLNEAQEVFVKIVAQPRLKSLIGFETNQRTIDDIRTVVVNQTKQQANCSTPYDFDGSSYISILPDDYWFFLDGRAYASKGPCVNKKIDLVESQHDDKVEQSPFNRSSFEWAECNIRFVKQGLRVFTDGTFTITNVCIDYIKQLSYIHNAQDYDNGTYETLSGVVLTGHKDSELPAPVHREIVDLAVYLTAMDIALPELNIKGLKVKTTEG